MLKSTIEMILKLQNQGVKVHLTHEGFKELENFMKSQSSEVINCTIESNDKVG